MPKVFIFFQRVKDTCPLRTSLLRKTVLEGKKNGVFNDAQIKEWEEFLEQEENTVKKWHDRLDNGKFNSYFVCNKYVRYSTREICFQLA